MSSAVTQKGQVTIPKRVRDALGIRPGTLVEVQDDGHGGARIVKVATERQGFARFVGLGRIPGDRSTDEYMALIRDPHDA